MEGIQTFKGSWPWPWPWIRPYGIPSCITHWPLPIYQISLKSKKLFVDGRTYVRTDGRTDIFPPSNIIRSTFGSRPKMEGIQTLNGSWPWIRPYGIPSCITHRPLPTYQISFKSKKLFVDGRMYGRTDGHFSPLILLGRLLEVDLINTGNQVPLEKWPLKQSLVWNWSANISSHSNNGSDNVTWLIVKIFLVNCWHLTTVMSPVLILSQLKVFLTVLLATLR